MRNKLVHQGAVIVEQSTLVSWSDRKSLLPLIQWRRVVINTEENPIEFRNEGGVLDRACAILPSAGKNYQLV